jgi:exosortase K
VSLDRGAWRAILAASLVLAGAYALKLAYSKAGASELEWVLGPSCLLARLGGIPLTKEAGAGWISHEPRMVVGAACAGVNFLIVCWLALYFSVQRDFASAGGKFLLLVASFAGAYLATLSTNGLRILLAARLYDLDIYAGWVTPGRVHRALGVVLYCSTLFGLCRAAELAATRAKRMAAGALLGTASQHQPQTRPSLAPFYWYLAVALGVPLANRAFVRDPAHFLEHAAMTVAVGLAVAGAFRVLLRLTDRLSSRRAAS